MGAKPSLLRLLAAVTPALAIALGGCGSPAPKASNVIWKVERSADKKGFHVVFHANYAARGLDGMYTPTLTLVDDRGCKIDTELGDTLILSTPGAQPDEVKATGIKPVMFDAAVKLKRPAAQAEMRVDFSSGYPGQPSASTVTVFSQDKVLDATLHPPAEPTEPCSPPPSTLAGTVDQTIGSMSRDGKVKLLINTAGFLCARVRDSYMDSDGQVIAYCTKYPSGRGSAKYSIDLDAMEVQQLE